jgi:hypothetical protein
MRVQMLQHMVIAWSHLAASLCMLAEFLFALLLQDLRRRMELLL